MQSNFESDVILSDGTCLYVCDDAITENASGQELYQI